jgi:hypothetical protein
LIYIIFSLKFGLSLIETSVSGHDRWEDKPMESAGFQGFSDYLKLAVCFAAGVWQLLAAFTNMTGRRCGFRGVFDGLGQRCCLAVEMQKSRDEQ